MNHVLAFTAQFKIPAVISGECTQTIRPKSKRPRKVGDGLMVHGWEGRPYWSKWSWRIEGLVITGVLDISVWPDGIFYKNLDRFVGWGHPVVEELAILDGCPDVRTLRRWFKDHYDLEGGLDAQIIRWNNGGSR